MPTVALLGTLDTKEHEYVFIRQRLLDSGVETLLIDAGVAEPVGVRADIDRRALAEASGADVDALATAGHARRSGGPTRQRG